PRDGGQLGADPAARGPAGGRAAPGRARRGMDVVSLSRSFRALTRSNDRRFVELLSEQADLTVRAMQVLERFGKEPGAHDELVEQVKSVEREGDVKRRILIDELHHTYVKPFEREVLFSLTWAVDDILVAATETVIYLSSLQFTPLDSLQ